jgi:hypothetical protein
MVDAGYVIVGSPTTVAEQLSHAAKSLNVGHLMLLLQFGNMTKELTHFNTDLFARRVLPEIHGLFDDEWEDHWWPASLMSRGSQPETPRAHLNCAAVTT